MSNTGTARAGTTVFRRRSSPKGNTTTFERFHLATLTRRKRSSTDICKPSGATPPRSKKLMPRQPGTETGNGCPQLRRSRTTPDHGDGLQQRQTARTSRGYRRPPDHQGRRRRKWRTRYGAQCSGAGASTLGTLSNGQFEKTVNVPDKQDWKRDDLRAIVLVQDASDDLFHGGASLPSSFTAPSAAGR